MIWIILLVFLPFILVISGILFFNIYLRKQITRDTIPAPALDQAYVEAEEAISDEEEYFGIPSTETEGGKS